jgi:hypothetical protein
LTILRILPKLLSSTQLSFLWLFCAFGCGASGLEGRVYHGDETSFCVGTIPSTWKSLDVSGDDALAVRDPNTGTVITVSARCGRDGDDVPLEALTKHLFIQFTDRQTTLERKFELNGREALRTELTAKLDGVKRRFRVVVLKKDGCVYDFSEIAVENRVTKDSDRVFDDVVAGFSTMKR